MKSHKQKEIADVFLFDVEVSEAELEIYQQRLEISPLNFDAAPLTPASTLACFTLAAIRNALVK